MAVKHTKKCSNWQASSRIIVDESNSKTTSRTHTMSVTASGGINDSCHTAIATSIGATDNAVSWFSYTVTGLSCLSGAHLTERLYYGYPMFPAILFFVQRFR